MAVSRCACSDDVRNGHRKRLLHLATLADQPMLIDGYNLLTTVEAALAGAFVLAGRDGCYRNMAAEAIRERVPQARVIDLGNGARGS
jgi:hypothetical protein